MSKFPTITMEELRSYPRVKLAPEQEKSPYAKFFNQVQGEVSEEQLYALNNGPCNSQLAMKIEDRSDLLLPGESSVEIGYCQMADGTGFVANRTFFPNATPEMFDWWINFQGMEGIRLAMWLPNAHLDAWYDNPIEHSEKSGFSLATRNWNRDHHAVEGLTSLEESGDCICRFYAPQEFGLDMHKLLVSPTKSTMTLSVLFFGDSLIMFGPEAKERILAEDPDAKIPFNVLFHAIRPVPGGCEMRSRFWMGKGIKNGVPYTVPETIGMDMEAVSWVMLRHTIQEMSNLATFLPEIYNMCEGKVLMPGELPKGLKK